MNITTFTLFYLFCQSNVLWTVREYLIAIHHAFVPITKSSAIWTTDWEILKAGIHNVDLTNLHNVDRRINGWLTPTQEDTILRRVEETPELSTVALARDLNANSSTVHKLLCAEGLYPFRYTTAQILHPDEFRTDLFEWLLQQHEAENAFISHILWANET